MISVTFQITHFRCRLCNTDTFEIDEETLFSHEKILSLHNDCKAIEFFKDNKTSRPVNKVVTQKCNRYYSKQWIMHKGTIICKMGKDFVYSDFADEIKPGAFRTAILRLKKDGKVKPVIQGRFPSYCIVGYEIGNERGDVTLEDMGVGQEFENILHDVGFQYPTVHDITIQVPCKDLYKELLQLGETPNKSHNGIDLGRCNFTDTISAHILVYTKTIQIHIGCSFDPIVYSSLGAQKLLMMLTEWRTMIDERTGNKMEDMPPVENWMVTHYHFNKDSEKSYSCKKFEVKLSEFTTGFIRFYSKSFPGGIMRVRLEQSRTPKRRLGDEFLQMTRTENFVYSKVGKKLSWWEAGDILDIKRRIKLSKYQLLLTSFLDYGVND